MAPAGAVSDLRVVLLGNSWSERSEVGNFLLGKSNFSTEEESDHCVRVSGRIQRKEIVLINTPDLLHPNISEDRLKEHVETCVRLSDPGPHVFLLVLQPKDFTDHQKTKLCRVLQLFSDQSFDYSLVLLSTSKENCSDSGDTDNRHVPLNKMIRMCKSLPLKRKDLTFQELLRRLNQMVEKNNGRHVICHHTSTEPREETPVTLATQAVGCGLGIMLFGTSSQKKTLLCNFIVKRKGFDLSRFSQARHDVHGEWRGKPVTVVKTPDMLDQSLKRVREEMKSCVSLCPPGPNVLLLLVKPSEFTEENRKTLKFMLSLFGEDAFKHSMVIITHEEETGFSVKSLLRDCEGRHYNMFENDHKQLMEKTENIVNENKGKFLTVTEEAIGPQPEHIKPALNLVLCGRRGAGKTSAAKAILGQTELHSVSNSSECVKHQGEVCGRWLSLVELPALYGKPQEAVMEESLRCISLCDPEGVHAFILVLPVAPLTDEDKGELETIQNTFSSRVNDFTMILFTVESDPTDPAVVNSLKENEDIQELCESCGGRSVVLNIKEKQQIPELLDTVEKMRVEGLGCFSKDVIIKGQIEMVRKISAELQDVKQRSEEGGDDGKQSRVGERKGSEMSDDTKEVPQMEVERILKEKNDEMKRKEEDLKKNHEEEIKVLHMKISEQTGQIEEERKLRVKQLKEKEESINKERKERKREREEEAKRQKKQEELRVHSEREQKETAERKLEQCRREMKRERDAWDKERKETWERLHQEDKQNLEEVKTSLRKLQEEYHWKRKKWAYSWIAFLLSFIVFLLYYVFYTHTL